VSCSCSDVLLRGGGGIRMGIAIMFPVSRQAVSPKKTQKKKSRG
jgi:hypothetical protein